MHDKSRKLTAPPNLGSRSLGLGLSAVILLGCGSSSEADPPPDLLTFEPMGEFDEPAATAPASNTSMADEMPALEPDSPLDTQSSDPVEQSSDIDLPLNDEPEPEPEPTSIFDETVASNTPGVELAYGGSDSFPGLTMVASNLIFEDLLGDLSVEHLMAFRSDFSDLLCSFSIRIEVRDKQGSLITTLQPIFDLPTYETSTGPQDCAGPGDVFYTEAIDFIRYAGGPTAEDVGSIEWDFTLGGYLTSGNSTSDYRVTNLEVVPGAFTGYALTGTLTNSSPSTLQNIRIQAFLVNAGGMPLARLIDPTLGELARNASGDFETGSYDLEFSPENALVFAAYFRN